MTSSTELAPAGHKAFHRDSLTWLNYGLLGYFSFLLTTPGPIMPFLRTELNLNYTLASFHFSAFAMGMIVAGLSGDWLARYLSRYITLWGGSIGIALGAVGLALSKQVGFTLASTFVMGLTGGVLLVTIQAILSDHHGNNRNRALTESNIFASLCAIVAPLSIGGAVQLGLDWRISLFVVAGLIALVFLKFRSRPIPQSRPVISSVTRAKRRLPRAFWAYWVVVFFAVSSEWCMSYWASDFLEKNTDLSKNTASMTLSFYYLAMLSGRIAGSWATRIYSSTKLLLAATALALAGFPLFWLASSAPLKVLGLFIVGFGIANLYPLTLVNALGVTSDQSDTASARLSLGSGLAMLLAPLLLGWMADQISIKNAYGLVTIFFVMIILMTLAAARLVQPPALLQAQDMAKKEDNLVLVAAQVTGPVSQSKMDSEHFKI